MEDQNYFKRLYSVEMNSKTKKKNGLTYIAWSASWAEAKKEDENAQYEVHENENGRPWFDDGKTAWVKTSVTIKGITHTEFLPILDFKNKAIPAENVTSMDANKAVQRCITKACARHGIGLYVYEGAEDTEENLQLNKLKEDCMELVKKKSALSETAKEKVKNVCVEADNEANGDPRLIEDIEILETLKKSLMAIRK